MAADARHLAQVGPEWGQAHMASPSPDCTDGWESTIARLLRLWRLHAYLDFLFMTRDPRFFLSCYLSDAILNLARVTAVFLLAERFEGMGTWTKFQVIFMLGYAMLVGGMLDTLFGYNILPISRRLGRGQFDHTLIQPQPVWMALLTEGFSPFIGSAVLVPGIGLMLWSAGKLSLAPSLAWAALLALNFVASLCIVLSFSYLWGSLAFWAPRAAEEVSSSSVRLLYQLKSFPLDGLAPLLVGGLLTALPVGFVAWYPCRALLGIDQNMYAPALTPLAALVLAAVAVWAFRKGMQHYARTGSQRYLSFGFRR